MAINYFRNKTPALETAREIESFGVKALPIKGNVADTGHVECIFEKIATEFGRLDILVSNAASGVLKPSLELTERQLAMDNEYQRRSVGPPGPEGGSTNGGQAREYNRRFQSVERSGQFLHMAQSALQKQRWNPWSAILPLNWRLSV